MRVSVCVSVLTKAVLSRCHCSACYKTHIHTHSQRQRDIMSFVAVNRKTAKHVAQTCHVSCLLAPLPPLLVLAAVCHNKNEKGKKRKTEKGSQTSLSSFQLTKYLSPSFIYASVCQRGCVSVCAVCVAHSNVINTRYIKL